MKEHILKLKKGYRSITELKDDIDRQMSIFSGFGGYAENSEKEAIERLIRFYGEANTVITELDVKSETIQQIEVKIKEREHGENTYASSHTATVTVKAYYADKGSVDYVYVASIEENEAYLYLNDNKTDIS